LEAYLGKAQFYPQSINKEVFLLYCQRICRNETTVSQSALSSGGSFIYSLVAPHILWLLFKLQKVHDAAMLVEK
jgi:hypothetical protein